MFGGFGLAAVGVVGGTVTGILSISAVNSAKSGCAGNRCPPSTYNDIDTATTTGNISTVAFIVGGAGAAAGVVGFLLRRSYAHRTEEAYLEPWVGPAAAGVRGQF
jgi:hypothetical protein